jgi:2'-5' RNA ligase
METVRAFLAIELSENVRQKIVELGKEIVMTGADVKPVEFDNLHLTLKFLGDVSIESVDKIHQAMKNVKSMKYDLEARGTGVFPNVHMARVVWIGVGKGGEESISIFRQLEGQLSKMGFPAERDFTPHITIARVKSARNREGLINAMERNRDTVFGETRVEKFVLKKSVLTPSGPIYSKLREVELEP